MRCISVAWCVLLLSFVGFARAESPAATPICVPPSKNINERLFLVQAVARMYSDCLSVVFSPGTARGFGLRNWQTPGAAGW